MQISVGECVVAIKVECYPQSKIEGGACVKHLIIYISFIDIYEHERVLLVHVHLGKYQIVSQDRYLILKP